MADAKRGRQLALCLECLGVQLRQLGTRNAVINLLIWGALAFVSQSRGAWWPLLLHPLVVMAFDALERLVGISPFSREQGTTAMYNHLRFVSANPYGGGIDLGFNFYDGNYSKTAEQAQIDKFEHAWRLLRLQEGMRVLDVGCGMGDWMYWLKHEKRCEVLGINVTDAHCEVVRQRGMDCLHTDWQSLFADKERFAKLAGRFDCVTFWDTIEHYCKASEITVLGGAGRKSGKPLGCEDSTPNGRVRTRVYGSLFRMVRELLDPRSACGTCWASTLHQTHSWKEEGVYGFLQIYAMISYYDGVYPFGRRGLSQFAECGRMRLAHEEDRTEDYRMTSLLERHHFGYLRYSGEPCAIVSSLCSLVTHPHFAVLHVDLLRAELGLETCWMWHLGGIVPHRPRTDAIAQLLWQVYERA